MHQADCQRRARATVMLEHCSCLSTPTKESPSLTVLALKTADARRLRRLRARLPGARDACALAALSLGALLLVSCAAPAQRTGSTTAAPSPAALRPLQREDSLWLERVEFGLDSASVAAYRRLGRERFLDAQLAAREQTLPAPIAAQIDAMDISHADPAQWLADVKEQRHQIEGGQRIPRRCGSGGRPSRPGAHRPPTAPPSPTRRVTRLR